MFHIKFERAFLEKIEIVFHDLCLGNKTATVLLTGVRY